MGFLQVSLAGHLFDCQRGGLRSPKRWAAWSTPAEVADWLHVELGRPGSAAGPNLG